MHKKSTGGKKTGARSGASEAASQLPAAAETANRALRRRFSHIAAPTPTRVGERLGHILSQAGLSRGLSQLNGAARAGAVRALEEEPWLDWMRALLPPDLAAHLVQVLAKTAASGVRELVVMADSPAWCARLRYALLEIESRVRERDPSVARLVARVLMPQHGRQP
jgi:hypothetical protein